MQIVTLVEVEHNSLALYKWLIDSKTVPAGVLAMATNLFDPLMQIAGQVYISMY